jgi:hypothetical protein
MPNVINLCEKIKNLWGGHDLDQTHRRTDARTDRVIIASMTLTSDSIIDYGGVYSCPPLTFFIFSHRFMTFGMYVHFQESICCIPILKIVHNYHINLWGGHSATKWRGPNIEMPVKNQLQGMLAVF